ncbi:MAG TPA: SAM-dependent methyltransferase [Steroidobacteraceae bacterium]|jgi:methyltransferase (TIGR00027 family)|nr:SAM-dependent methyltransferase [Steroidobacteraceae bacterium]
MKHGQPSRTALAAAAHRAAHQVLEGGTIFFDPLAVPILGDEAETLGQGAGEHPSRRAMRSFIAARSRFAEDALGEAYARGVRQLVILGAGLDTFAYRNPYAELRVFEVDHPATQAWKRQRLGEAGIEVPGSLTFAPVDFQRDTLAVQLALAGVDPGRPAFFTWLGVVPYLTEEAAFATLAVIGVRSLGTQVVFDYADPPSTLPASSRQAHLLRAARVAELGEPWLCYFEPSALKSRLAELGFSEVRDLGPPQIARRYFSKRAHAAVPERGGHIVLAGIGAR